MFKMPSLRFFSPKKLPLIGIDITNSAIKLLEIQPVGSQLQIVSYGVVPLKRGAVADRRIKDYKSVAHSIKRVIDQAKPSTRYTAVAVPTTAVITRTLSLPLALDDTEMEALVFTEAEQHIPYPLHEVALDFQRQPPLNPNDENQPVVLIACRKEVTDQLDYALEAAGLEPLVTDVENFVMERSLNLIINQLPNNNKIENQMIALVDIGATTNVLNVLCNGKIIYSREQIFGGKQLTDEIQQHYQMPYAAAGLAKKHGNLPTDYHASLLMPFKAALIQQIERQLQLFYSSTSHPPISQLILAGGSSAIENLPQQVEQQLGYPTYLANPFADMLLSDTLDTDALAQDAPAMMIACGLAMRVWS